MAHDSNSPITESSIGGFKLLEHINTYWDLVEKTTVEIKLKTFIG